MLRLTDSASPPRRTQLLPWSLTVFLSFAVPQPEVVRAQVSPPTSDIVFLAQGTQIRLNGRVYPAAWAQWQDKASPRKTYTGISDAGLVQNTGLGLLKSAASGQQPVQWFSPLAPLKTRFSPSGQFRYLEISDLARQASWQIQAAGSVLEISAPPARIESVRLGQQPWGARLVLDLDRPTTWQVIQLTNSRDAIAPRQLSVTVDATLNPGLAQLPTKPAGAIQALELGRAPGRTTLQLKIPGNLRPHLSTLADPNRLLIDLRPDPPSEQDVLWAPGLRWREQVISLGQDRYPVTWLAVDPRQPSLKLQPIWSNPKTLVGTTPLATMAQRWQAAAAINGGFFNRETQLPLGAIRRDGRWLSSPILNRGAIAWNQAGEFKVGRVALQETLTTASGQRLPVLLLNSGYVQAGTARYTPDWGPTYTPLTNDEILTVVQSNQVVRQVSGGPRGKTQVPIPGDGYLLTTRGGQPGLALPPGTVLQHKVTITPAEFDRYPQVLAAGPVLVEDAQVVLDAKTEQFRPPFDSQSAPRSAIAQTADGTTLIVAVHNRVGGPGPTLAEMAQLMQRLGAVNALNLDGGSSTALYLGGQLLDRHPSTAVRVHNGIGIFIQPRP